jgi:hypothetical protein
MDQLHMHFASAIHNTAFTIVLGYVELCASGNNGGGNFQKRQYPDLCKVIYTNQLFFATAFILCMMVWLSIELYLNVNTCTVKTITFLKLTSVLCGRSLCSFIHSFIHSCIHSFIYSFIHSFIHLYIHPFIHSFIHSFIYTLINSFIHSFILSVMNASAYCVCLRLHLLLHLITCTCEG